MDLRRVMYLWVAEIHECAPFCCQKNLHTCITVNHHFERVAHAVEQFASVGMDQSSVSTVCSGKRVASQLSNVLDSTHPTEHAWWRLWWQSSAEEHFRINLYVLYRDVMPNPWFDWNCPVYCILSLHTLNSWRSLRNSMVFSIRLRGARKFSMYSLYSAQITV